MQDFLRIFLPLYLLGYLGIAFVLPSYRVWKQTGVNPVTFGRADNAHDYIGKLFKIAMVGLTVIIVIYVFAPSIYSFLLPVVWLENKTVQLVGVIILLISAAWTVIAQIQMGNSWRIGIDEKKQTLLVEMGIFCFSRNPIFLGMIFTLFGIFLTLPNALTLLIVVLGYVLIQIQVRLEEEFLTRIHGNKYAEYCCRVRRWL